jgi:hypothetical protein
MNTQQTIHLAMINSYNVILGHATVDEVLEAGIGVFTHIPDEDIDLEVVQVMLLYFQEVEMYEHCSSLVDYIKDNWNEDGTRKMIYCECDYPSFDKYEAEIKCNKCNKPIL